MTPPGGGAAEDVRDAVDLGPCGRNGGKAAPHMGTMEAPKSTGRACWEG